MSAGEKMHDWLEAYPSAITVCDIHGIIVAMNEASRRNFAGRGGGTLIGTSLFDCHPESANDKIRHMLRNRKAATYIVERRGKQRLIHQAPWYKGEEFAGLVETIIDLTGPVEVRKKD